MIETLIMGRVCARIHLENLARRLSRLHGKAYLRADVHLWLKAQGFEFGGAGWHCDGSAFDVLQPNEVLEVIREVNEDGVTFIEHDRPSGQSAEN
jgi:hypothetical protein